MPESKENWEEILGVEEIKCAYLLSGLSVMTKSAILCAEIAEVLKISTNLQRKLPNSPSL